MPRAAAQRVPGSLTSPARQAACAPSARLASRQAEVVSKSHRPHDVTCHAPPARASAPPRASRHDPPSRPASEASAARRLASIAQRRLPPRARSRCRSAARLLRLRLSESGTCEHTFGGSKPSDSEAVGGSPSALYQRIAGTSAEDTLEQRFQIYAGSRLLGEIVRTPGAEETLYFHTDHQGSVHTLTSSLGNVLSQRFDPFGAPIDNTDPATRFGFTGHQHDDALGLIDMRGRVFDALAGRFATPDPIMQAPYWSQGLNRYAYVFNNPINLVDPSGFAVGDAGFTVNGVAFNNGTYYEFGGTSLGGSSTGFSALGAAGSIATGVGNVAGTLSMGSKGGTFHVGHPTPSAAPASNVAAKGTSAVQQAKGQAGPPPARRNWQPGDIGPPPPPRPDWMNAPHGAQAPSVANRILNDPAFQIPDTSEDLQLMMEIIMAAAPIGPKGIGLAKRALPAARGAASIGRTVLGHHPEYLSKAAELGARRFNIPTSAWERMSDAQRWAANQKFLDRVIARGDEIILATPAGQARAGSWFARELEYLAGRGYAPSADGLRMLRAP